MRHALVANLLVLALATAAQSSDAAPASDNVDYTRQIKPLLKERCFACHAALKQESSLRLDSGASILRGGDSGEVVVPGSSDESLLVERISAADAAERMPPEGKPLSTDQIALVRRWIDEGAVFPTGDKPEEDPKAHWAFRKIAAPPVPHATDPAWVRNPIDAFIAAQHSPRGLQPMPEAEKHVLLRRVYLDLIGLPPTRAQLAEFLADSSPGSYEKVVDRLLASPQYGERWARHWMDVWRYSDWYGRRGVKDVRNSYPQIWRWRDWIVRSLNADKPYDRMITEMLAADEVVPGDDEAVVATGYLVRSWFSLNYNVWMKDLVEHTGKAFLGLTINCAMCHDHKYDPITQQEYFKFRAFFEPLELRQDRIAGLADPGPFQKYIYPLSKDPISHGLVRVFDEKLDAKTYMFRMGDERNVMADRPPVEPAAPAFLGGNRVGVRPVALPPVAFYPGLKSAIQAEEPAKWDGTIALAQSQLKAGVQRLAAAERTLNVLVAEQNKPGTASAIALAEPAKAPPAATALKVAVAGAAPPAPPPAPKAPSKLRQAQFAIEDAQLELRIHEARLANAMAQRASILARIAADNARYKGASGQADELVSAASLADRPAKLRAAEEKVALAQKEVVLAQRIFDADKAMFGPRKRANEQMAKAEAELAAARAVALHPDYHEYTPLSPQYPRQSTGRRKALAAWITSRDNPLTARVAVNYMWMHHFGRPLVETTFNFGRNGKRPTHPELLDYLAAQLADGGWNMKRLHRLMVTSTTYRLASNPAGPAGSANLAIDPDNHFLWRASPRRMEAEVVRDSILHLAGSLDTTMGGAEIDYEQPAPPPRRSLYFSHHAEGRMKLLMLFDAANATDCYRRTETIVPQQALALVNSRFIIDESRRLARTLAEPVRSAGSSDAQRQTYVTAVFAQILARTPSKAEQGAALAFLDRQSALARSQIDQRAGQAKATPAAPAAMPAADAAKQPANGVPPSEDAEMRARESLARALLNHNDFVSIR